jgi:RNA polymerase sigma-70 factor, ECF subfamily
VHLAYSSTRGAPVTSLPPTHPNELEAAFEAHHRMVYRTAYRVTGNSSDAEDVLQTGVLRMLKRETDATPVDQTEGYLRRAAVNASIDLIRTHQRTGQLFDESMPSSASCTELRELRDSMRKAIAKLDARQAEMIALRYFEGYSNKDIASMLGITQINVAVTLHRAKARLQKELTALNVRGGGQ